MWVGLHSRCTYAACLFTRRILALNMITCFSPTLPNSPFNNQLQLHQHHHKFIYHRICIRRMSSSVIESLPSEILLQICELLRDTHTASIFSLSETSHKVRKIAAVVLFQKVILPIHNQDSVEEDVKKLSDTLGPLSALSHIRTLRLCRAWNGPNGVEQRAYRGRPNLYDITTKPAELVWTYD
jgi:hypothetical protein